MPTQGRGHGTQPEKPVSTFASIAHLLSTRPKKLAGHDINKVMEKTARTQPLRCPGKTIGEVSIHALSTIYGAEILVTDGCAGFHFWDWPASPGGRRESSRGGLRRSDPGRCTDESQVPSGVMTA